MDSKQKVLVEPIIVGREFELEQLQVYFDSIISGKGTTVFISGEAGSGKTRVTSEFLRSAKKQGAIVLSGWCLSNAALPYFPFLEAFDSIIAENEEEKSLSSQYTGLKTLLLAPNVQEGIENQESLSSQVFKDQKFAAVTKQLLFLSTEKPLVLFLDDLHWADSASLSLLHYVARAINSERILVLGTFRNEELGLSFDGFPNTLVDTIRIMAREELINTISLPNLSTANVGRIAESMLGRKVDSNLVEKLAAESHGNALFVIETVRMLFESDSLLCKDGQWQSKVDRIAIPLRIKDIILRRVDALKPNQRRTLEVASVIGEKFDPQLLGAILNQDSLEVLETLNSIARSKSLVAVEGDYYRFDHAKSKEILYEEILTPLKKGYHLRVAEKIENLNEKSEHPPFSDLAYHYSHGGNAAKSVFYSLAAGKEALTNFSNAEAINHFNYVIKTVAGKPNDASSEVEAMEGLGDAFAAAGLFKEAIKTFQDIDNSANNEAVKLRALRKAVVSCYWLGDSKLALELAAKAKQFESVDRIEYARLLLYKGFISARGVSNKDAIIDMSKSLSVFEEECSLPDVARALVELSFVYPWEHRLAESLSSALRAVALYEDLGDVRQHAFAIGRLGVALEQCGLFKEALKVFSDANKIEEKIGDYNSMAFHLMMMGTTLEFLGDNQAALKCSLQGLEAAEKTDAKYAKSLCLANLVRENARLKQLDIAKEFYGKLQDLFRLDPALSSNINAVRQEKICYATLLCAKGQWKEAADVFEKYLSPDRFDGKKNFAYALAKMGRTVESNFTLKKIREMEEKISAQFVHCNVYAYLLSPRQALVNGEIRVRIDIVNIGGAPAKLKEIKDLVYSNAKTSALTRNVQVNNNQIDLQNSQIDPIKTQTVKVSLIPQIVGDFKIQPQLIYTDELGEIKNFRFEPITITVKANNTSDSISAATVIPVELSFKSETSEQIFTFLQKAFKTDDLQRIPKEKSGWRTLMDLVKEGKISKHSLYSSAGKHGSAIAELERSGLVECRVFGGERGRGGNILKVRVAYEKEAVRRRLQKDS